MQQIEPDYCMQIVRRKIACFAAASRHEPLPQASIVINAIVAIKSVACTTLSPRIVAPARATCIYVVGPGQPTTDRSGSHACAPSPA